MTRAVSVFERPVRSRLRIQEIRSNGVEPFEGYALRGSVITVIFERTYREELYRGPYRPVAPLVEDRLLGTLADDQSARGVEHRQVFHDPRCLLLRCETPV